MYSQFVRVHIIACVHIRPASCIGGEPLRRHNLPSLSWPEICVKNKKQKGTWRNGSAPRLPIGEGAGLNPVGPISNKQRRVKAVASATMNRASEHMCSVKVTWLEQSSRVFSLLSRFPNSGHAFQYQHVSWQDSVLYCDSQKPGKPFRYPRTSRIPTQLYRILFCQRRIGVWSPFGVVGHQREISHFGAPLQKTPCIRMHSRALLRTQHVCASNHPWDTVQNECPLNHLEGTIRAIWTCSQGCVTFCVSTKKQT